MGSSVYFQSEFSTVLHTAFLFHVHLHDHLPSFVDIRTELFLYCPGLLIFLYLILSRHSPCHSKFPYCGDDLDSSKASTLEGFDDWMVRIEH